MRYVQALKLKLLGSMLRASALFVACTVATTAARPMLSDPHWGPCDQTPQEGDRVLIHSVDPLDQGTCVETHLDWVGRVDGVEAPPQPYNVVFETCADICRSNDCGSDCSIGDTTCQSAGTPGNGCGGCDPSVKCDTGSSSNTCYFRETEIWCEADTPPPPPPPSPLRQDCQHDGDCEVGTYCDSSNHCYHCDYINPGRCDDESGTCCSTDFLSQCPSDPADCGETCDEDGDCDAGSYCDESNLCSDCDSVEAGSCDDVSGDCCSDSFLSQCPSDPAGCKKEPACDLSKCECDGVSLESLRGKVYHPPVDAEGYTYAFSMCDVLPEPDLPSGCQQYAERPSVVKYKADNPADCIEIGSIGPCSQGECGMTGTAQPNGVQITYTYTYGCQNTFTLDITSGTDSEPGQINSDECSYSGQWEAKDFSFDNYRCEHDRCVKSGRHLQGLAKEECEAVCGEPPRCVKELIRLCGETADESSCEFCAGSHDIALGLAGCKHDEIHAFCASNGR